MPQVNRLVAETGIPLVATNDAHYLRQDDARAHEILLCIQTGKTMSRSQPHALRDARVLSSRSRDRNDGSCSAKWKTRSTAPGRSPSAAR